MADDEEICILSGEDISAESLVLLNLPQPSNPQEQLKQYNELKNSFVALLKAYQDLRKKLADAHSEINTLKKRKTKPDTASDSKPSTPAASMSQSSGESAELARVIMMYNDRVLDILNQVDNQFNTQATETTEPSASGVSRAEVSVQAQPSTSDAETQHGPVHMFEKFEQTAQTGESLSAPLASGSLHENPGNSFASSMVIPDMSDAEESDNGPKSETIKPSATDARIRDTQLSRLLLVDASRQRNTSNKGGQQDIDYKCPICGLQFSADTLEAQAVEHLMQCTSDQQNTTKYDCPMCNKTFELNSTFTREDYEVHVQCCCDAGELNAVVL